MSGGVGIVTIDRVIKQTAQAWATILQASLPGGVRTAVITRAPVNIDDKSEFSILCVVSTSGTVSIINRSHDPANFGTGCNSYGEVVFPLA